MSIKLMTKVWEAAPLQGSHLLVMLALADWSNDYGVSWYGIKKIAQRARVSERQAQRILADLELQGYIAKEERMRENGSHTSNYYTIYWNTLTQEQEPPTDGGGDMDVTRGGDAGVTRGGDIAMSPQEPSLRTVNIEPITTTGNGGETQNVFTVYQNNIGMLTPMIAEELQDAEKTYGPVWVVTAIEEAVLNNKRNWKYVEAILKRWSTEGFKSARPGSTPTKSNSKSEAISYAEQLAKEM